MTDVEAMKPNAGKKFSSVVTCLGYLPMGSDTVCLSKDTNSIEIIRARSAISCCCFGTEGSQNRTETIPINTIESAKVIKPITGICRCILNFTLFGILAGFFLHSVVAGFVTVEESLGSSKKHTQLGMIWGILWITSGFMFSGVLRPVYVRLTLQSGDKEIKNIEVCDKQSGLALIKGLQLPCETQAIHNIPTVEPSTTARTLPSITTNRKWGAVVAGTFALIAVFLYTPVLFLVFVEKCSECGGCNDKGLPRPGCYYEGHPERPIAAVVVFFMVVTFALSFYGRCARVACE